MSGRLFQDVPEAIREIRRDVFKSPKVLSARVQNLGIGSFAHEALNYQYSVINIPEQAEEIVKIAIQHGIIHIDEGVTFEQWLALEIKSRISWDSGLITETLNPHLVKVIEGNEPSYSYTDRLRGMVDTVSDVLINDSGSRRAYWPMFLPEDAIRAVRFTRIPCTLGYWFAIRTVEGEKPKLHITYLERSCDFRRFWLFDLWFARKLQIAVLDRLQSRYRTDVTLGQTSHVVLSLHAFIEDGEEIY